MACTRLPVVYRMYWLLKVLGLLTRFHCEEYVKAVLVDEKINQYRTLVREVKVLSAKDERLCNFVWERLLYIEDDIDGGWSALMEVVGWGRMLVVCMYACLFI